MKRIKISVTQQLIDDGIVGSSFSCPVNLGIKEKLPFVETSSGRLFINFHYYGHFYYIPSPRSVKRFINRFDQGLKVKPFNFYLVVNNNYFEKVIN